MPYKVFVVAGGDNVTLKDTVELWRSIGVDVVTPLHDVTAETPNLILADDVNNMIGCDGVQFLDGWELCRIAYVFYLFAEGAKMAIYSSANPMVDFDSLKAIRRTTPNENISNVLKVCHAIKKTLGVTFLEICGNTRFRNRYFGRLAFVNECQTFADRNQIEKIMGINGPTYRNFMRKFSHEIKYNKEFAIIMAKIQEWRK